MTLNSWTALQCGNRVPLRRTWLLTAVVVVTICGHAQSLFVLQGRSSNRSSSFNRTEVVDRETRGIFTLDHSAPNRPITGNLNASHAVNLVSYRPPRLYFLFLAVDKVSNLELWKTFFLGASAGQFLAFVHCKLPSCQQQVFGSPLQVVPTVPGYYCTDLVSPMQQMINQALQDQDGPANNNDKFIFISDSTLPAKPFSHIYSALSERKGSDFCVFPTNEWADVQSNNGVEFAVKHHQWITLQRPHAEKAWKLWSAGTLHNFMTYFRMNQIAWSSGDNAFADSRNYGCLDEFWFMLALYGSLHRPNAQLEQDLYLSMYTNGPLHMSASAGWQGQCDTFVLWWRYLYTPGNNPFNALYNTLDQPSIPHGGNIARPGWWDTISTHGLRAIRSSSFLFARKFIDNPRLSDGPNFHQAFVSLVLAE